MIVREYECDDGSIVRGLIPETEEDIAEIERRAAAGKLELRQSFSEVDRDPSLRREMPAHWREDLGMEVEPEREGDA